MALLETSPELHNDRYQEPNEIKVFIPGLDDEAELYRLLEADYRYRRIGQGIIYLEKKQAGVRRYPPVQIQVARDSMYIQAYLDLPKNLESQAADLADQD